MITESIPLVSWGNGTLMIGVFALVVVILVVAILIMVNSGDTTKKP